MKLGRGGARAVHADGVPEDDRCTCRSGEQGGASARGFKDNNDHKDIKDAREGNKGRARYGTHRTDGTHGT